MVNFGAASHDVNFGRITNWGFWRSTFSECAKQRVANETTEHELLPTIAGS